MKYIIYRQHYKDIWTKLKMDNIYICKYMIQSSNA